jgi:hypothetical protein
MANLTPSQLLDRVHEEIEALIHELSQPIGYWNSKTHRRLVYEYPSNVFFEDLIYHAQRANKQETKAMLQAMFLQRAASIKFNGVMGDVHKILTWAPLFGQFTCDELRAFILQHPRFPVLLHIFLQSAMPYLFRMHLVELGSKETYATNLNQACVLMDLGCQFSVQVAPNKRVLVVSGSHQPGFARFLVPGFQIFRPSIVYRHPKPRAVAITRPTPVYPAPTTNA